MAGKTQGEKIDELSKLVATLTEREDNTRAEVRGIDDKQAEMAKDLGDLRTNVALMEHQLADIKSIAGERRKNLSTIVAAVLGAVIGAIVSSLLTHFILPR